MNSKLDICSRILFIEENNGNRGQDRQVRKWMISEVKEFLDDSRILYNYVSSLQENSSKLKEFCEDFKSNKLSTLQNLQYNYTNELNFLKDIGGDVSNYPKYLTKPKK